MKVRRFTGATSRAVLEKIREALGADAVIVSNRSTPDGIEITAMPGTAFDGLVAAATGSRQAPEGDRGDRCQSPNSHAADTRSDDPTPRAAASATANAGDRAPTPNSTAPAARAAGPATQLVHALQAAPSATSPRASFDERADEDVRVTLKSHVLRAAASARDALRPAAAPATAAASARRPEPQQTAGHPFGTQSSGMPQSDGREQMSAGHHAHDAGPLDADAASAPSTQSGTRTQALPFAVDANLGQRLAEEVAAMRAMLGEQMEQQAMSDAMKRSPLRARSLRELLLAGYSTALARSLVQNMPDDYSSVRARAWMVTLLAHSLRCVPADEDLVTRGGVYALVGPTGVGKTTTTAKLAARCAVRYGASRLALFTTDSYRVGAHDQLRIYARILGVTVQTIGDRADLRQALDAARGKHLVLIDTVGMGQRDARLPEHAALLDEPEVQRVLLLNAATQPETLEEVVCRYGTTADGRPQPLAGTILTKLDEAARLGPALDVAIRHRLALQGATNGQRVPEDFAAARADYLVGRSLRPAAKPSPFAFGPEELALLGAMPEFAHA